MARQLTQTLRLVDGVLSTLADVSHKNIRTIHRIAALTLWVSLVVSFFHQAEFFYAHSPVHWDQPSALLNNIMFTLASVLLPIGGDFLILNCVLTLSTPAATRRAKIWAFAIVPLPTAASGYFNFMGAPNAVWKAGFLFAVALIPLSEIIRANSKDIDYRKVEELERKAMEAAKVVEDGPDSLAQIATEDELWRFYATLDEDRFRLFIGYDELPTNVQRGMTRRWTNAKKRYLPKQPELADPVAAVLAETADAPVSPAVVPQ